MTKTQGIFANAAVIGAGVTGAYLGLRYMQREPHVRAWVTVNENETPPSALLMVVAEPGWCRHEWLTKKRYLDSIQEILEVDGKSEEYAVINESRDFVGGHFAGQPLVDGYAWTMLVRPTPGNENTFQQQCVADLTRAEIELEFLNFSLDRLLRPTKRVPVYVT